MLLSALRGVLLPLLLGVNLLTLTLFNCAAFHRFSDHDARDLPGATIGGRLHVLQTVGRRVISLLPLNLLIRSRRSGHAIVDGGVTSRLLPRLGLRGVAAVTRRRRKVVRTAVGGRLCRVHVFHDRITPHARVFVVHSRSHRILMGGGLGRTRHLCRGGRRKQVAFVGGVNSTLGRPTRSLTRDTTGLGTPRDGRLTGRTSILIQLISRVRLTGVLTSSD